MKITLNQNKKVNHHEMILTVHPKNKKLAEIVVSQINNSMDEIVVFDEYRNRYPISIHSIYYIEMVDHKMFIYTESEVYRLFTSLASMKEQLGPYGFYQINVKTLVNSHHVVKYAVKRECRRQILMDNDEILVSNRAYKPEFEQMIDDMNIMRSMKEIVL